MLVGLGLLAAAFAGYWLSPAALHARGRRHRPRRARAWWRCCRSRTWAPPGDQYFADGLTEEITSRLAGLSGLRVISRTSADQYRASHQVDEGDRRGAGGGRTCWRGACGGRGTGRGGAAPGDAAADPGGGTTPPLGGTYEAELGEVFRLQSEIAQQVAASWTWRCGRRARRAGRAGTRSTEAYDLYLRGNDYLGRSNQQADLTNAASLFQQAVTADPKFATAYAKLARAQTQIYWHHYDHTAGAARARPQPHSMRPCVSVRTCPRPTWLGGTTTTGDRSTTRTRSGSSRPRCGFSRATASCSRQWGTSSGGAGGGRSRSLDFVEALRYDPRSGLRSFDVGRQLLLATPVRRGRPVPRPRDDPLSRLAQPLHLPGVAACECGGETWPGPGPSSDRASTGSRRAASRRRSRPETECRPRS